MRKLIAVMLVSITCAAVGAAGALAANPPGTGPPEESCQAFLENGGRTPGHAASSPGSPFDEPEFGPAPEGGTGGQNYSPKSRYDVACFQVSPH
jgi:hypothetical protein